jgi:beta-lactamase regulating signal transducer with metallopeptidase domain
MISAAMLYVLAIGVAVSILAWAAEQLLASRGLARRFVWAAALLASVIVPIALMSIATPAVMQTAGPAAAASGSTIDSGGATAGPILAEPGTLQRMLRLWPSRPELDILLGWTWGGLSCGLILWLIAASWALSRRLRDWPIETFDGQIVRITKSTGPAVCGVFATSVVIPRWVAAAPKHLRELILLHEQCHLRANDPLLFRSALLLVVLAPWNLPMWWLLHRLRFAIEVDCDARVLRSTDQDVAMYGEALLTIGQQPSHLPAGSVALNESASQLERRMRIMMIDTPRISALAAGALALLAGGVVAGAATLNAPSLASGKPAAVQTAAEVLIPPPKWLDLRWAEIDASLRTLLERQYPQFLGYDGDEIPLIEVLFGRDGGVERAELRMLASRSELRYRNILFEKSDAKTEALAYVQPRELQPPASAKPVHFHFGERMSPTNTYAYANSLGDMGKDSAAQDEYVLNRYFSDVAQERVTGGPILWVLLDREGKILESGREAAGPELYNSSGVLSRIMARFPEIRTNGGRMSTVLGTRGQPLQDGNGNQVILNYFWLEQDSPFPGSWARR